MKERCSPNKGDQDGKETSEAGFNRKRAKLSFERMLETAESLGLENPLFRCQDQAAKATALIDGKEYINFSTYDYLDINAHPEITAPVA